jgi:hypothetical protein
MPGRLARRQGRLAQAAEISRFCGPFELEITP